MNVYYNEIDPFAVAWLRKLMEAGLIPHGFIDTRSIVDVQPDDLLGFDQCHFFAGIGGWPQALQLSSWPEDSKVWTGSCPCQPFSVAGKGKGEEDERHLWPEFYRLIEAVQPPVIFGEQVASKPGKVWLSAVRTDLEALGYEVGAADLCAAGVGAPHIRQRIYFGAVGPAHTNDERPQGRRKSERECAVERSPRASGLVGRVADATGQRRAGLGILLRAEEGRRREKEAHETARGSKAGWMAESYSGQLPRFANGKGCQLDRSKIGRKQGNGIASASGELCGMADANPIKQHWSGRAGQRGRLEHPDSGTIGGLGQSYGKVIRGQPRACDSAQEEIGHRAPSNAAGASSLSAEGQPATGTAQEFWGASDWLYCRDGKWRPVEPSTFPLAHGVSNRVGLLRGYGNAIVPQVAEVFIRSFTEALAAKES